MFLLQYRGKSGFLLYVVIFVLLFLGILVIQFHQFSRQAGMLATRSEKTEFARQFAESAIDEAFNRVWNQTTDTNSKEYQFLFQRNLPSLKIDIPLVENQAPGLVPGLSLAASASMRIVDFHDKDRVSNNPFFSGEGLGTLQLSASVQLMKGGRIAGQCTVVRHHDFKILTVTTNRNNRPQYTQDFLLDYALFVRKGYQEFTDPTIPANKSSYNNGNVRIVIEDQDAQTIDKRGRIFLGGTDQKNNSGDGFIFLNVADSYPKYKDLVPNFPRQKIHEINFNDCCKLIPGLRDINENEADRKLTPTKGIFEAQSEPLLKSSGATDDENKAIQNIINSFPPNDLRRNISPGVIRPARNPDLAHNPAYVSTVFEGAIRQRFLWLVRFYLDASAVPDVPQNAIDKLKNSDQVSTPNPMQPTPEQKTFCEEIKKLDESGAANLPLISRFEDNFLWQSGQPFQKRNGSERDAFSSPPAFRGPTGTIFDLNDPKFRPYGTFSLRFRNIDFGEWLSYSDTYNSDSGHINIRRVVRIIREQIQLKGAGAGPLTFSGKGVIIADDGFRILSGIQKDSSAAPDDFLVLYTQKSNIYVDTDQEIEAVLMAIGNNGKVIPSKPLKLKGGMAVDTLGAGDWPLGEHSIRYNPVLMNNGNPVFQIIPSPQITFQKIMESES